MYVDTHCHLDAPILAARLPEVLAAAARAGVRRYIVPGVDPREWGTIQDLVSAHKGVFAAAGVHPALAHRYSEEVASRLETFLTKLVAVGEIGLDYLLSVPREVQREVFRAHLRLAGASGLPVIIHCRHAFRDLLTILREERVGRVGGVMHAFSGSPEIARECLALGLAIGVAGPVTFPNAVRPVAVARYVPVEKMVLETDAPDLTPAPYQGQPNEPAFLLKIAEKIAEIKGVTVEAVAAATTRCAERVFHLSSWTAGGEI